ncbi:hypothetical protein PI124_g21442 [Phytophthora idaei]|nr:hypothetical protein PI124_g21442 [Phytophthora idaei]
MAAQNVPTMSPSASDAGSPSSGTPGVPVVTSDTAIADDIEQIATPPALELCLARCRFRSRTFASWMRSLPTPYWEFELFRGQTTEDYRPNKALRPWLYRAHLPSYPQLGVLCSIAAAGLVPPWKDAQPFRGAQPIPKNYQGANTGATIVRDKLRANYYKGRYIVAQMATLVQDPMFHSSAFALVPKKDNPLHVDGRIIHDLSAPDEQSINAQTASEASPHATWEPFVSIARRVCDLRRRYPGYNIYAMIADIVEAFHHVPVHSRHASIFGGFFAVFGKAVRHYQRTGSSFLLGHSEPFWIFQWVDDIVLIEIDVGDRLQKAEKRLRDGLKLVFGSDGWHEGKFTTWSRVFHAVGIDWNIPDGCITVPQRKIDKVHSMLVDTLGKAFISRKRLDSLIGVLWHVISFIPTTKPFIQRLTLVQNQCREHNKPGVPMTSFLRKDLMWWNELVFQNESAGLPMELFEKDTGFDESWLIVTDSNMITLESMRLRERLVLHQDSPIQDGKGIAAALNKVTREWGPRLTTQGTWCRIIIHGKRWTTELVDKTTCKSAKDGADSEVRRALTRH